MVETFWNWFLDMFSGRGQNWAEALGNLAMLSSPVKKSSSGRFPFLADSANVTCISFEERPSCTRGTFLS